MDPADTEREVIAAYVSGLNGCSFCYRGHKAIADVFGVSEALIDKLVAEHDSEDLSPMLRAALRFARKLTERPSRMVQADADSVCAAGWDDKALMNIIEITALFAMYNRLADGAGVRAENTQTTLTKKKMGSYIGNLVNFGVPIPDDLKPVIGL